MDALSKLLDQVKKSGVADGHLRGFFHVLIGRVVTRHSDKTVVSKGISWRELAGWLKKVRWDPEAVRELGLDPDALPPRDRQRFWYSAIVQAKVVMESLRQVADASPGSGTVGIENLNDLGILSNGNDNTLSLSDTSTLDNALANNLTAVQNLFTNSASGIATTLNSYLQDTNGPSGVLARDENNLTTEETSLTDSITTLQQKISNDQTTLTNEFTNMETAINSINTEKQVLNDYFSSSSTSSSNAAPSGFSASSSTGSSSTLTPI